MDTKKIDQIIDFLIEAAKNTGDFASREFPLLAAEIIKYSFISNLIWFALFIFVAIALFVLVYQIIKKGDFFLDDVAMFLFVVGVVFLIFSIDCGNTILKAHTAPRLLLLEKLKEIKKQ